MSSERGISNQRCGSYNHRSGSPYGSCCQPKRFKATTDSRQLQSEIQACSPSTASEPQDSLSGFLGQHHCHSSIRIQRILSQENIQKIPTLETNGPGFLSRRSCHVVWRSSVRAFSDRSREHFELVQFCQMTTKPGTCVREGK